MDHKQVRSIHAVSHPQVYRWRPSVDRSMTWKGTKRASHDSRFVALRLGLPLSRMLACRPSCSIIRSRHAGSPKGRPSAMRASRRRSRISIESTVPSILHAATILLDAPVGRHLPQGRRSRPPGTAEPIGGSRCTGPQPGSAPGSCHCWGVTFLCGDHAASFDSQ